MIQIKDRFPKGELQQCRDVWWNAMPRLMGCHAKGRVECVVPNHCKVQHGKEPNRIRFSSSVKQRMSGRLEPLDCSRFNRVLMLMMGF